MPSIRHSSAALLLLAALVAAAVPVAAESRLYRGRLSAEQVLARGLYDLRFHLHDSAEGTRPLASLERFAVPVEEGRFQVQLDFPVETEGRWLEIEVAAADSGGFEPLAPRQWLGPAFESPAARSSTADGTAFTVELVSGGNLRVAGKVVAGGFQLGEELITSWSELAGGGAKAKLAHRSRTVEPPFPEMQLTASNVWVTGSSKSITVDGPGQIWVVMTGGAIQGGPFTFNFGALVGVGIGTAAGGQPVNIPNSTSLGNGITHQIWTTQHVHTAPSAGTYTFYAMALHSAGSGFPVLIHPEAMTLLFVPN